MDFDGDELSKLWWLVDFRWIMVRWGVTISFSSAVGVIFEGGALDILDWQSRQMMV